MDITIKCSVNTKKWEHENLSPVLIEGADVSLSSDSTLPNIVGPSQAKKQDDEKQFKCPLCEACCFYKKLIATHMEHAHN